MAEPRSFLDVIRDLNIGPRGLSPSAYSRVGSAEQARQAQTALENRPAPTPLTIPNIDVGRGSLQAARMSAAADPVVQQMSASLAPVPQTVSDSVSMNLIKALNTGSSNANRITEADRKADMTQTLMGGDMQAFMQNLLAQQNPTPPRVAPPRAAPPKVDPPQSNFISNLLRMFAQPEFQQAGFAGQGFGPTVLGATRALRAMETQDIEAAKLQAAEQERAAKLQATQASEANKAAVDQMRLAMEKERLGLARQAESRQETQDRVQRGKLTKTQLEGLKMLIESDPQIKALMETLDGTGLGRLLGFSPSTENVTGYITSRVVELQAADPSISVRDAAIQAASELANKATTASDGSTNVKPAAGGVDKFKGQVGR